MSNRHHHLFQFAGSAIAAAAREEANYHLDRLRHWTKRRDEARQQAQTAGVEIREQPVTGGVNVQLSVNSELQARLNLCASKIQTHTTQADRFDLEARAYLTSRSRTFDCDPDDILHFRLCGGERDL